jgi:hypothetical protein
VRRIKRFWNWINNEAGRTLYLDGYIAPESWFEDDITPKEFKKESICVLPEGVLGTGSGFK